MKNYYKVLPRKTKIEKISKVKMDSRIVEKTTVFFALNNGKNYIDDVLKKGAALVVCDDKKWAGHERVAVVENTLTAMQNLAHEYKSFCKNCRNRGQLNHHKRYNLFCSF